MSGDAMTETALPQSVQSFVTVVDRAVLAFSRHWLLVLTVPLAVFVGLPWLAPALMAWGYELPARAIYFAYSLVCHQLPQRSYFLFGPKATYSLAEISAVWEWRNLAELRRFIGTPEMGYKVAFAHRLTAIYLSIFVGSLLFGLVRRWLKADPVARARPNGVWHIGLPLRWYVVLILPMFFDGVTHMLTDALPFVDWRETNAWAVALTGGTFGPGFYQGTTLGTLNWLLRTATGALFGFATVWLTYPYIEQGMADIRAGLEGKFQSRRSGARHLYSHLGLPEL